VQRQELTDAFRISVPIAVPGMARNWAIIVTLPYKVVLAERTSWHASSPT
jgi:methyl-accepting chemotaxis protein